MTVHPCWSASHRVDSAGSLRHIDENVFAFDRHREMFLTDAVVETMLARRDIVLPTVPRAGNDAARDLAFGNWAACVRADPIHRMKASVHTEQRHDARSGNELLAGALRDIVHSGDTNTCTRQISVLSY